MSINLHFLGNPIMFFLIDRIIKATLYEPAIKNHKGEIADILALCPLFRDRCLLIIKLLPVSHC